MGKRKERRLAALSNTGRRVKLDLFAEPCGDVGGSSVHDEVGGDTDPKERAGFPNSPTSSGQEPQNPLQLLGQYSDDEVDGDSETRRNSDAGDNSLPDHNDEVMDSHVEGGEDAVSKSDENLIDKSVTQEKMDIDPTSLEVSENPDDTVKRENYAIASGDINKEADLAEQASVHDSSDVQIIGEVSAAWKMVMHEESNSYYYWNIETGETSWEMPDGLTQAAGSISDQNHLTSGESESNIVKKKESISNSDVNLDHLSAENSAKGSGGVDTVPHATELSIYGSQVNGQNEGYRSNILEGTNGIADVNQSGLASSSSAFNSSSDDANLKRIDSELHMHGATDEEQHKAGFDLSSRLVNLSEYLLERLNSLKGSNYLQGHDWMLKYILEVEIRLSDIKSLLSYGSSLLPFWEHSDRQLKQLESDINKEIYQMAVAAQLDEVNATDISNCTGKDKLQEQMGHESAEAGVGNGASSPSKNSHISPNIDDIADGQSKMSNITSHESVAPLEVDRPLSADDTVNEPVDRTTLPDELDPKHDIHNGDDVDMDVDMEVECMNSAGNATMVDASVAEEFTPPEQPVHSLYVPTNSSSVVPEIESIVPPPSEEEWIPPPPPDNEEVPPPPPDEPPDPLYPQPPSYIQTGEPLSYTEQYSFTYPDSSFAYGQTVMEVPSSNYYSHSEVSQVALPHGQLYYDPVSNTYTNSAPVVVNVEPVAFNELQNGTLPPLPVVNGSESFLLLTEAIPVSYDTHPFSQIGSTDSFTGSVSGPNVVNVDTSFVKSGFVTNKAYAETTTATDQAPATNLEKENTGVPSNNTTSAATRISSKASRPKKRTVAVAPSLRSNKKVSSLVDKWKAAKEELLEDEEEPENAYEKFERKRQREIEEWHSQQIASGEARDNANFQPLGGDWRERVKRRRAQLANKASNTPPEEAGDGNQQHDLTELSKDLPSGWKAYWDDSSKQVYYGNTMTSETTWMKPTK